MEHKHESGSIRSNMDVEMEIANAAIIARRRDHEQSVSNIDESYVHEFYKLRAKMRLMQEIANKKLSHRDAMYFVIEYITMAMEMLEDVGKTDDAETLDRISCKLWEDLYC